MQVSPIKSNLKIENNVLFIHNYVADNLGTNTYFS